MLPETCPDIAITVMSPRRKYRVSFILTISWKDDHGCLEEVLKLE